MLRAFVDGWLIESSSDSPENIREMSIVGRKISSALTSELARDGIIQHDKFPISQFGAVTVWITTRNWRTKVRVSRMHTKIIN